MTELITVPDPIQPRLVASSKPISGKNDFFKSCILCFNDSVALTTMEDRTIGLYNLQLSTDSNMELALWKCFPQAGNVICTAWYPLAVPDDPSTFCFLASVKDCPIKLLDGTDGRLRASYRLIDHRERYIAPHCISFNSLMTKIYCGFQDAIEVFDVNCPGEGDRILTTPTKKSKDGIKGIVSSLAFSPDYSGLYAAGTLTSTLVTYDENVPQEITHHFGGVLGPITQVKFHPMKSHLLFATSRQTGKILCWDLRGDISTPLLSFDRLGFSNQRIMFDIDEFGNLVTGDTNGFVTIYNVDNLDDKLLEFPRSRFKAHSDTVSAVALHRREPMLVSVSGSRHFDGYRQASCSSSSLDLISSGDEDDNDLGAVAVERVPFSNDTSIKLWNVSLSCSSVEVGVASGAI